MLTDKSVYRGASRYVRFRWNEVGEMDRRDKIISILIYPIFAPVCLLLMFVLFDSRK